AVAGRVRNQEAKFPLSQDPRTKRWPRYAKSSLSSTLRAMLVAAAMLIGYPVGPTKLQQIREDRTMRHRCYFVGAAMSLFAFVAITSTPAMATPCTNLQSLQLQHATITSAT